MLISDVVLLDYKRCNRRPFLDFYGDPKQQEAQREFLLKLREENRKQVLEILGDTLYHQPETSAEDWQSSGKETLMLMEQGVDCILNGVLWQTGLAGWDLPFSGLETVTLLACPSLLVKQPGSSIFGDWQYEAVSVKLGRRPKPEYKLVSAFQAKLLALIQGSDLVNPRLMVKSRSEYKINLSTWIDRMEEVLVAVLEMLVSQQEPEVFISRQRCGLCQWQSFCYNIAQQQEHLSLLPGVTPNRYEVLQKLGLTRLEKLAQGDSFLLAQELGKEIAFD
ncbi:MAG: TM0106 family RecB-like putative nuclease, partial [Halothece sp. Uz-M2-17]|nr:TM0106 family RecB-like putative nuclease [Halothece sp. Uz-M2-17]